MEVAFMLLDWPTWLFESESSISDQWVRFLGHDICKQHSIELNAFCSSLRPEHLKVRYKQMLQYRVMIPVKPRGLWSLRSKPYGLAGTSVEDPMLGVTSLASSFEPSLREGLAPIHHFLSFHFSNLLLLDKLIHTRFKNDGWDIRC